MIVADHLTREQARQVAQHYGQRRRRHAARRGHPEGYRHRMGGGAGAMAAYGMPAAAGGADLAQSVVSVVPGIRRLKRILTSAPIPAAGGRVQLDLPKSSYLARCVVRIEGQLQVIQPATPVSVTATDPRTFVSNLTFQMSGTVQPRILTGVQHDVIDNLDVPVVNANASQYSVGPAGAANSTTNTPFTMELTPRFTISDQNLTGIPYLGAPATVPNIVLTFGNPNGTLATPGGTGATVQLVNGIVSLEGWRIDLPSPVAPQEQQVVDEHGHAHAVTIPGQGLWQESSWLHITKMVDMVDQVPAGNYKKFKLATGPNYTRIILLANQGGSADPETSPLLDRAELIIQQATSLESKRIWQFDNEYRQTYYRQRPKGVYVFSGVDLTGTDSDLYVTGDLGNFDLDVYSAAPGSGAAFGVAGTQFQVLTQTLQPISSPGQYL